MTQRVRNIKKYAVKFLRPYIGFFRAEPFIIQGVMKGGNKPIKLLYIGPRVQREYLVQLIFSDKPRVDSLGLKFFWQLLKLVNKNSENCNLVFVEGTMDNLSAYQHQRNFFIPLWLKAHVELPFVVNNNSARSDCRLIRKHDFTYMVSDSLEQAQHFYESMYSPYILSRFDKGSVLMKWPELRDKVTHKKAEILFVYFEGKAVAGVVVDYQGTYPKIWSLGVISGDRKLIKIGVTGACYYFLAQYLHEKSYKVADFGYCRAFLNDGVLKIKRKWGAHVVDSTENGYLLKPFDIGEVETNFLQQHSFIHVSSGELYGAVFSDVELIPESSEKRLKALTNAHFKGIKNTQLYFLEQGKVAKQDIYYGS